MGAARIAHAIDSVETVLQVVAITLKGRELRMLLIALKLTITLKGDADFARIAHAIDSVETLANRHPINIISANCACY